MVDGAVAMRGEGVSSALMVSIRGKITSTRWGGQCFFTSVVLPAVDEFSAPRPFELRSEKQLGREGDVIEVKATVGGYFKKTFQVEDTDPRTGEVTGKRIVRPIVNTLDVIH